MHVGLISSRWHPAPGGVERHTRDLARTLIARGHSVSAFCLARAGDAARHDTIVEGVRVRRWRAATAPASVLDLVDDPDADRAVRAWLAELRPDLVHVHHFTGLGHGVLEVVSDAGVPTVVTLHDYWSLCPRGQMWSADGKSCWTPEAAACGECQGRTWPGLASGPDLARRRTERAFAALRRASVLVAPSQAVADAYARGGLDVGVRIVANGTDSSALAQRVRELRRSVSTGTGAPGTRLVFLGSVQPTKGALQLALIVHRLELPALTFDVHGPLEPYHGDASYVAALQRLAELDRRIRLHGPFAPSDLASVLALADAVAVPSCWEEPYGLVAREAVAAGLRVFASRRGGLAELAREAPDHCVLLGSEEEWSDALHAFGTERGSLALDAPLPLMLEGTLEAMTDRIEAIYRDLESAHADSQAA
ncbi:MAG: glycosyltransferase family 4 protein [bacterium]|nr:glycosyltransferase family 4 protein [bacterium]